MTSCDRPRCPRPSRVVIAAWLPDQPMRLCLQCMLDVLVVKGPVMPYQVKRTGDCPDSKPWAVVKESDGKVMGCHETKEQANAQLAALNAAERGRNP